jgi:NTE family protein
MPHPLLLASLTLLALVGCAGTATPPQATAAAQPARPAKLGLALGGGAARGFAHVGVIKALESQGIVPDIVVGSSAGAVVGALYAAGNNGFELQKLAHRLDETKISDWSLPDRGVLKGESLQQFVNDAVGQRPLEGPEKPFGAVATDLRSGESIVFPHRQHRHGGARFGDRPGRLPAGQGERPRIRRRRPEQPHSGARGTRRWVRCGHRRRHLGPPGNQPVRSTFDILLQTFTIMGQSLARTNSRRPTW